MTGILIVKQTVSGSRLTISENANISGALLVKGNLGVGTTAPGVKVEARSVWTEYFRGGHVSGIGSSSNTAGFGQESTGSYGFTVYTSGTPVAKFNDGHGGLAIGTTYMGIAVPSGGMITQGNVGIRTSAPKAQLDVVGTISGSRLSISNNANISGSLLILNNLTVRGTFSGATLHASSQLRSSGTLVVEGNTFIGGTIENGLVGWWAMDSLAGTGVSIKDLSINSNTGTLMNGPVHTTGKFGKALTFDGTNDFVKTSALTGLPVGSSPRTFSTWVYQTSYTSDVTAIIDYGANSGNGARAGWFLTGDTPYGSHGTAHNMYYEFYGVTAWSNTPLSLNKWYHVAVTVYESSHDSRNQFYINGIPDGWTANAINVAANTSTTNPVHIGMPLDSTAGAGKNFTGTMDEVRIYSRALSAREISELYRSGSQSLGGTMSGIVILEGNAQNLLNIRGALSGRVLHAESLLTSSGTLIVVGNTTIRGTLSGNILHAEKTLSSSGALVWEGTASGKTLRVMAESYFLGKLGVGTASPSVNLDVYSPETSNGPAYFKVTNGNGTRLGVTNWGIGIGTDPVWQNAISFGGAGTLYSASSLSFNNPSGALGIDNNGRANAMAPNFIIGAAGSGVSDAHTLLREDYAVFTDNQSLWDYSDPGARVQIKTSSATRKGLIILGAAGQTANLQEWQNSAGTALSFVTPSGSGSFKAIAIGKTPVNGREFEVLGTISGANLTVSRSASISGTLIVKTGITSKGSLSGATFYGAGLGECTGTYQKLLYNPSTGQFTCGSIATSSTFGTGNVLTIGDARYLRTAGGTMTGTLVLTPTAGSGVTALRIVGKQTLTGSAVFQASAAGTIPMTVKGAVGQTANLQEWQSSDGTALASVSKLGIIKGIGLEVSTATPLGGSAIANGLEMQSATQMYLNQGGNTVFKFFNGVPRVAGGQLIIGGSGIETSLYGSLNTLEQRNATSAQSFRFYNTYTSATNFERLETKAVAGANFEYGPGNGSAGGALRGLTIGGYVNGSSTITPWLTFTNSGAATFSSSISGSRLVVSGNANITGALLVKGNITSRGTLSGAVIRAQRTLASSGALVIKKYSGTATGNILIVDTAGLVYDATNKRVGVGTASPAATMDIYGGTLRFSATTNGGYTDLTTGSTNGGYFTLTSAGNATSAGWGMLTSNSFSDGASLWTGDQNTGTRTSIFFGPGSSNFSRTGAGAGGVIDTSGKIGIGTVSPKAQLDVRGTISGSRLSISGNANITGALLVVGNTTIRGTLSGNILHAEKTLTSSGTAIVKGNITTQTGSLWQPVYKTDDGLVGYWNFSETGSTTAYDRSPYGNDGTLTGGPTYAAGKFGTALRFDGTDDYITVGSSTTINMQTSMTFAGWFKANGDYITNQAFIGASTNGNAANYGVTFGYTNNKFEFWQASGGPDITSTRSISDDNWHHYAVTRTGTTGAWTLNLYIDGVLDKTGTSAVNPSGTTTETVAIGRFGGYNGYYLKGTVDDFRLYNRALSEEEIRTQYLGVNANNAVIANKFRILNTSNTVLLNMSDADRTLEFVGTLSGSRLSISGNANITGALLVVGNTTIRGTLSGNILHAEKTLSSSGRLIVTGSGVFKSNGATVRPLVIMGAASQTANLTEWQNSAGTVITKVGSAGDITLNGTTNGGYSTISVGSTNGGYFKVISAGNNSVNGWGFANTSLSYGAALWTGDGNTGTSTMVYFGPSSSNFATNGAGAKVSIDTTAGSIGIRTLNPKAALDVLGTISGSRLSISGNANITGALLTVGNITTRGTLSGYNLTVSRSASISGTLIVKTGITSKGSLSGSTFYGAGLGECTGTYQKLLYNPSTGQFTCGSIATSSTFGTGNVLTIGDARYVKKSGDTMTGILIVKQTVSGSRLTISENANISGALLVKGNLGVGTTAPGVKVEARSVWTEYFRGGHVSGIGSSSNTAGFGQESTGSYGFTVYTSGTPVAKFNDGHGGLAIGTTYMGIAVPSGGMITQGNVGIRTSAPKAQLDVVGTISGSRLSISNNANISGSLLILNNLTVRGTFSGATLHASSQLRSSGTLVVEGNTFIGGTIENGLVGWWAMDSLAGTGVSIKDLSINSNTGTLMNGPVHTTGKFGKALTFDGTNDFVKTSALTGLPVGSSPRTFSTWVYQTSYTSDVTAIIDYGANSGNGARAGWFLTGDTPYGSHGTAHNMYYEFYGVTAWSNTPLSLNKWYHVAVTVYESSHDSRNQFYINGIPDGWTANAINVAANTSTTNPVHIGMPLDSTAGAGKNFTGTMDEVRIYSRALSAREISELYRSGSQSLGGTMSGIVILEGNAQNLLNIRGALSGRVLHAESLLTSSGTLIVVGNTTIRGTLSGNILHAEKTLSSSGALVWEGTASGKTLRVMAESYFLGKLGVGTASPSVNLDVYSPETSNGPAYFKVTNGNGTRLGVTNWGIGIGTDPVWQNAISFGGAGTLYSASSLSFNNPSGALGIDNNGRANAMAPNFIIGAAGSGVSDAHTLLREDYAVFTDNQSLWDYSDPGARVQIKTSSATRKGLIILGAAGQTANLQEWQNSAGTALSFVTPSGSGSFKAIAIGKTPVNGREFEVLGTISGANLTVSRSASISGTLIVKTGITSKGSLSGATFYGAGLGECTGTYQKLLYNPSTGQFTCGSIATSSTFGTGNVLTIGDARYLRTAGGTMTGTLVLTPTAGSGVTALRIVGKQTLTGSAVFQASAAGTIPMTVKGAVGQTANLQEWQSSDGTALASVSKLGIIKGIGLEVSTATPLGGSAIANGLEMQSATQMYLNQGGNTVFKFFNGVPRVAGGQLIIGGSGIETSLYGSLNTLEQRNATSAQSFRFYNTYTSATNFERLETKAVAGANFEYGPGNGSAGGALRGLTIGGYVNGSSTITPWLTFTNSGAATFSSSISGSRLVVSGNANITGALLVKGNITSRGTLSGAVIRAQRTLASSGALVIKKYSGTATGNILIVDTAGLVYDATNKRVGVGTASPAATMDIYGGTLRFSATTNGGYTDLTTGSTNGGYFTLTSAGNATSAGWGMLTSNSFSDGASLWTGDQNTGTRTSIFFGPGSSNFSRTGAGAGGVIDTSGKIGIGTVSPKAQLDVRGTISGSRLSISGNANITGALLVVGNTTIRGTLSGNILHAEKTLTSSGTAIVKGNITTQTGSLWQPVYKTDDGLVGYWNFSETGSTTAYDRSPYGNDGTLTGGPTYAAGKFGTALRFDGTDDYITVGSSTTINMQTSMTFAGWFKANGDYITNQAFIGASTNGNAANYGVTFGYTNNKFEFWQASGGPDITSTRSISDDNWHHYAVTRTGTTGAWTLNLYIDGVLDKTGTSAVNPSGTTTETVAIGRFGGYNGYYLKGTVDDFRLYNRALSEEEIRTQYLGVNANNAVIANKFRILNTSNTVLLNMSDADRTLEFVGTLSGSRLSISGNANITGALLVVGNTTIRGTLSGNILHAEKTLSSSGRLIVTGSGVFKSNGATVRPLVIMGAASQTANLTEWQNSAGTVITKVGSAGDITLNGTTNGGYSTISVGSTNGGYFKVISAGNNSVNGWGFANTSLSYGAALWTGDGNTGTSTMVYFGPSSSNFATNGAGAKVSIDTTAGSIGIRTLNPKAALDVLGTISGSRLSISGNANITGALLTVGNITTRGTLSGYNLTVSRSASISGTLIVKTGITSKGSLSGSTFYGAGLGECTGTYQKLLYNPSTGQFTCGSIATSSTFGTGNVLTIGDARYLRRSGGTMTGQLIVDITGGNFNTIGLKIINTLSGAHLHAERLLSTSGTIVSVGNIITKGTLQTSSFGHVFASGALINELGGFNDMVNIQTGNFGMKGITRLNSVGNLQNIGSVQAGEANFMRGGVFLPKTDYTTGASPQAVAIGDLNGDGKADLAVPNYGSASTSIFLNNGNGTFAAKVDYTTGSAPISVAIGDLNGDGKADLATSNYTSSTASVFLNKGNGTFAAKVDYTTGTNPTSVAIGDLNGDGKADLAVTNGASTSVSVFLNNGNGTFAAKVDYTTGSSPYSVAIGDLNGDGKADLSVANYSSTSVSVFLNNGNGTFAAKVDYTTGTNPTSVAIGDLNGDGKADLAVANFTNTSVSVFLNNGNGTFAAKVDYTTGTHPFSVAIGDLNGDGKADLSVANYSSTSVSVFLNNGNGTFAAKVDYTTGSQPISVAIGDLNGDGKEDFAVANYSSTSVSVFLNIAKSILYASSGTGGAVGIGTSTPGSTLSVSGSALIGLNISNRAAKAQLDVVGTISGARLSISGNANITGALLVVGNTTIRGTLSGNILHAEKTLTSSGRLIVTGSGVFKSNGATVRPLVIMGAASQAANLTEWQNSAGTTLASITSAGDIKIFSAGAGNPVLYTDNSGANGNGRLVVGAGSYHGQNLTFDPRGAGNFGTIAAGGSSGLRFMTNSYFDGSVGIGTLSAKAQLDVIGTISGSLITQNGAGNNYFSGNLGVGTVGPESKVQISGGGLCVGSDANCNTDNNTEGVIYSSSTAMSVYDLAENYPTKDQTVTFAEIVSLDTENGVFVKRASKNDRRLLGIISEEPAILLGGFNGAQFAEERQVAVALSGRVPVKITTENGAVRIGDPLTISSQAGVAMKAGSGDQLIGYALQPFERPQGDTSVGEILVFVGNERAQSLIPAFGTGNVLAISDARYLKLSGGTINGSLAVTDDLTVNGLVTFSSLQNCPTLATNAVGQVICGPAPTVAFGTGNVISIGDARYLKIEGGDILGSLAIRDNLTVSGTTTLARNLTVTATGVTIKSQLAVQNAMTVSGTVAITNLTTDGSKDLLTLGSNVGGTGNTVFRVNASGAVFTDSTYQSGGADYAEYFKERGQEGLKPGEVVCIDPHEANTVMRCTEEASGFAIGMISSRPSYIGNSVRGKTVDRLGKPLPGYVLVGLIGQIDTKVLAGTGSDTIKPGDALTPASTPGFARKARAGEPSIGVAMEGLDAGTGMINVLVSPKNRAPSLADIEKSIQNNINALAIGDEIQKGIDASMKDLHAAAALVEMPTTSDTPFSTTGETILEGSLTTHGMVMLTGETMQIGPLSVSGSEVSLGSLMATGSLKVIGNITISGLAIFLGDVHIQGELVLSNRQAGFAVIPATGTRVTVLFSQPMTATPVVVATPDVPTLFAVSNVTASGFTIRISPASTENITFTYIALSADQPRTTQGTGAITAVTSIPFPVDALGRPVSNDKIWNSCVRGQPMMQVTGEPVSCSRYHDGYVWQHPDLLISFTYSPNHEPPLLIVPEGFTITQKEVTSSSSSSAASESSSRSSESSVSSSESSSSSSSSSSVSSSEALSSLESSMSSSESSSSASESPLPLPVPVSEPLEEVSPITESADPAPAPTVVEVK